MNLRRRKMRWATIVMMVLLTLLSGLPATSCYCADGHLKLFCAARFLSIGTATDKPQPAASQGLPALPQCPHCGHCGGQSAARSVEPTTSCCRHTGDCSQPRGKGCRDIPRALAIGSGTGAGTAATPLTSTQPITLFVPRTIAAGQFFSLRTAQLQRVDSGPPIDLVIARHCFLI